jgi:hypothetical protein
LEQLDRGVGGLSKVQAQKALADRPLQLLALERQASDKDAYATRSLKFQQSASRICFARVTCERERKTNSAPNFQMKPRRSSSGTACPNLLVVAMLISSPRWVPRTVTAFQLR